MLGTPTVTASTKRSPAAAVGKVTVPVAKLASVTLAFAPLPISPEAALEYKIESPRKAYETGVMDAADILAGDVLTTGGVDYYVRGVGKYPPETYMKLILERVE